MEAIQCGGPAAPRKSLRDPSEIGPPRPLSGTGLKALVLTSSPFSLLQMNKEPGLLALALNCPFL